MHASPAELQPGSTLSHYRVLECVGGGAMGTVYRARDKRLARDVAFKVINPEIAADPDRIGRFRREATILAALNHPGIVVIHDTGHENGQDYAAHVDHLRYGLSLMNRWAAGENPFEDTDWAAAWEPEAVSQEEWAQLRQGLRTEVDRSPAALQESRAISGVELNGVIGSVVHLAYHLEAIRQIDRAARGPREGSGGA